jgi:DNA invertase Pin-like site-specific DNA recombinase
MSKGQTVGYVRVSSVGQNTARQLDGIELDRVFEDKCSGSTTDRPGLAAMLAHVRDGDTVVVHEISRLARNTADLLALVEQLNDKGVTVKFNKEDMTFHRTELDDKGKVKKRNPMNMMLLTIIGAISAFELSLINERRAEGQAKAREAGKHMGRHAKLTADQVTTIRTRAEAGESKVELAQEFKVSRATLYAALKAAA